MIPLIPTLALAFVSFISSAFVILRIVIPILLHPSVRDFIYVDDLLISEFIHPTAIEQTGLSRES